MSLGQQKLYLRNCVLAEVETTEEADFSAGAVVGNTDTATASTSTSTGSLRVIGGAGVSGQVTTLTAKVVGTTASTSTSTGSLVVGGGVGVAGALFVGTNAKFGTAVTDTLGFYGASAVAKPAIGSIVATAMTANAGTAVLEGSTFGNPPITIGKLVNWLQTVGIAPTVA